MCSKTDFDRVRPNVAQGPVILNPLTPELNLSAQRCLPRFFTGDFNF
jgi:hypothetical protein